MNAHTNEEFMRKTILALSAAALIGVGTIATPTKSEAHPAALVVVAIVAAAIVGTVVIAEAATPRREIRIHPRHRHHRYQ